MDLVARYDLAAGEKDVEAMVEEHADDDVIGGFYSTGEGKEAMRDDSQPSIFEAEGNLKRHLAPNLRISGDGDVAQISYVLPVVEGEERPAVGATTQIRGELRKVEGRWLIARHHIGVDPSIKVGGQG